MITTTPFSNSQMPSREEQLGYALHCAAVRDSLHAWKNAEAQLGPISLDIINDMALAMVCATHGSIDVLGELKRLGADLHCVGQGGRTPIDVAIENGDEEMVALLQANNANGDSRVGYSSYTFSYQEALCVA